MAFTTAARRKIFTFVQATKQLLSDDVTEQLQQFYGFRKNGTTVLIEELTSTEADVIYVARTLRQRLAHIHAQLPPGRNNNLLAVTQLVREQAFTVLNRLASLRMAEERRVFDYMSVRGGYQSEGFQIFDAVTGQGQVADTYTRYRWYLHALFDELATDLPAVFDRFSPQALVFPQEATLTKLLALLNAEDLAAHVEEGLPTLNLWQQDETLGWLYQYYNGRDEITAMRKAAATPRDSRELAIRNQFFTPRYVVEFLLDNTLGRLWYDMTNGQTDLKSYCKYLSTGDAETPPRLKDPTEIKLLDPACGSMHFGLYAFDLFVIIYREAWHRHPNLLLEYRNQYYTDEEFYTLIPGLILAHNLYGVDIDPRALQMAGLSLWLRAQRAYQDLGLAAAARPAITRANLVLAEPMPGVTLSGEAGEGDLLADLLAQIDQEPVRHLLRAIYEQMRLAGEAGMLLRMERVVEAELDRLKTEWNELAKKAQTELGEANDDYKEKLKAAQLYGDPAYRKHFFKNAENLAREALQTLTRTAAHRDAYRQLLFADDSARGLAFVDLCRLRYDVVVMNPPFGAASSGAAPYLARQYPRSKNDLAAVFVERMHELLAPGGRLGALSTRTIFFLGTYEKFRQDLLIARPSLRLFADLGMGVLDALVETAAYVLTRDGADQPALFLRATKADPNDKAEAIRTILQTTDHPDRFVQRPARFAAISNTPLCYWVEEKTIRLFEEEKRFKSGLKSAKKGMSTTDNFKFTRLFWEVQSDNFSYFLASPFSLRFFTNTNLKVLYGEDGILLESVIDNSGKQIAELRNKSSYFSTGLCWAHRTSRFQPSVVPEGAIFTTGRYLAVFTTNKEILWTASLWNSDYLDYTLKLSMERVGDPKFINGVVNQLPHPNLPQTLQDQLAAETRQQHGWIERVFQREETSLYYRSPALRSGESLRATLTACRAELAALKKEHLASLGRINAWVYAHFGITAAEQARIRDILAVANARAEGTVFNVSERSLAEGVFSWLVGVVFGRWDLRLAQNPALLPRKEELFSALPPCSPATLVGPDARPAANAAAITDEAWLRTHDTIEGRAELDEKPLKAAPAPTDYPVAVLWDGLGTQDAQLPALDLMSRLRIVLRHLWPADADRPERELADLLGVETLDDYLNASGGFFARHLAQYTQNKRAAPIYWPLTSPGGRLTVWVYYPRLTNQTLYRIINEVVQPRQRLAEADLLPLAANPNLDAASRRHLADLRETAADLRDFEDGLLRVARHYQPNPDDGVLLIAAPLHRLFRGKWRKLTEDAWHKLEAGDYDWAHLALSLWPARVRDKCRTDLSLAIAHNLESLCEVKPKEKKTRKAQPKKSLKSAQLPLEE